ncbi:MAG TPA: hypothetical protein VM183_06860 [Burkholderiales bacterium]|nr:hypothetical protein [Burkholderiales bacterium]
MVSVEVIAVTGGKELPITGRISAPARQEDGSWLCTVELAPLQQQGLNVRGVDSFHAIWLACSLILKVLVQLKESGADLRSHDGSEFPLDAYLAGLDEKS